MLYKFKSQAAADVIMLRESAEDLLKIIGKPPGGSGIVTVAQIPDAIAALRAEIARRETQPAAAAEGDEEQASGQGQDEPISLRRRAAPFIELLERSLADKRDVVWGV